MRRPEREVRDGERIDRFILSCDTVRLGFPDPSGAYIVPMSFGYESGAEGRTFYFHCAREGRKMDCLRAGDPVGFELDRTYGIEGGAAACSWTARYMSVTGTGEARLLAAPEDKARALDLIMLHYAGRGGWKYPAGQLEGTAVFVVKVLTLSCKSNLPEGGPEEPRESKNSDTGGAHAHL